MNLDIKSYLKNFGKGLLIGLIANIILSIIYAVLRILQSPVTVKRIGLINFFLYDFITIFVFSSIGLLLFGLMYVIYSKLGGKKPTQTLSVAGALIVVFVWFSYSMRIGSLPEETVIPAFLSIILTLFLILILFITKVVKENKAIFISTLIWFLIITAHYFFVLILFFIGLDSS